jgi:hypothetical protein
VDHYTALLLKRPPDPVGCDELASRPRRSASIPLRTEVLGGVFQSYAPPDRPPARASTSGTVGRLARSLRIDSRYSCIDGGSAAKHGMCLSRPAPDLSILYVSMIDAMKAKCEHRLNGPLDARGD